MMMGAAITNEDDADDIDRIVHRVSALPNTIGAHASAAARTVVIRRSNNEGDIVATLTTATNRIIANHARGPARLAKVSDSGRRIDHTATPTI